MRTDEAPLLVVRDIELGVRPVHLRLPFRFGAVTLQACPQLFVHAVVELGSLGHASGYAAEMMVPKWFDKREGFSHADNVQHLVSSLAAAREAYIGRAPSTAFNLSARYGAAVASHGQTQGLTALSAAYGPAVIDRAVLDGLCRAMGLSVFDAVKGNAVGLADTDLTPDLRGFAWQDWLATLAPRTSLQARHTVGMLDALERQQPAPDDGSGLPSSLAEVIERYGHRVFKIKLGGEPQADLERLQAVLALLERAAPGYGFSLDGNEQYDDRAALLELFRGLRSLPALARRPQALLYIEQPVPRHQSLDAPLPAGEAPAPLLMDEADGQLQSFVAARPLGWTGVSSKGCKGLYKAVINRARCDLWNREAQAQGRYFMSAEDLTCQAGLSVQQDLALASLLGLAHCERNGHHYADGMATSPAGEQASFAQAHPDLYETSAGHPRLRIDNGTLALGSLFSAGFASGAAPAWDAMKPLSTALHLV
jgi:hypothetical protein